MRNFKLSNKAYDRLKEFTTVWLPALGTLYFALSGIWGFPYGEGVVGTITALVTFFGTVLKVSTTNYRADKVQDTFNSESIEAMMSEDGNYEDTDYTAK